MTRREEAKSKLTNSGVRDYGEARFMHLRDWSLIMGRGELQNGRGGGGQVKFYLSKRGGWKSFSHAEGGWGSTSLYMIA